MIFKKTKCFSLAMLLVLSACGSDRPSDLDLQDERQEVRFVKMLDERKYQDVIDTLGPHMHENSKWKVLVGQAQLGLAEFEPIFIASKITGAQQKAPDPLESLIPRCSNDPLNRYSQIETACVLKRLIHHLPPADNPFLRQGLQTIKNAYPKAESTPKNLNFLLGLVELSMAVSHLGKLMIFYDQMDVSNATDGKIQFLYDQSVLVANHADQSFYRARFAGKGIASALTGLDNFEVMDFSGSSAGGYRPGSGFPELIEVANPANRTLEIKLLRTMLIQNLDRVVEGFKRR